MGGSSSSNSDPTINNCLFGAVVLTKNADIDSEIVASPLCLGNIPKGWSVDNMKRTGFTGYVYDFSVGYDDMGVDNIKSINKYLMEKMI